MKQYRFRTLQANKVPDAEFIRNAASDDEACEIASDLLDESECPLVEVWQAGQRIYVVGKISDPAERCAQKEAPHGSGAREAFPRCLIPTDFGRGTG